MGLVSSRLGPSLDAVFMKTPTRRCAAFGQLHLCQFWLAIIRFIPSALSLLSRLAVAALFHAQHYSLFFFAVLFLLYTNHRGGTGITVGVLCLLTLLGILVFFIIRQGKQATRYSAGSAIACNPHDPGAYHGSVIYLKINRYSTMQHTLVKARLGRMAQVSSVDSGRE